MTMQSIEPLHTVKRASRLVERTAPCAFLEFMTAGKHPATLTDTIFSLSHRDLAHRCSQCNGITEKHVRAKNSNGTTVGKFYLLRGRFTLLPSFRSLPHYALLVVLVCLLKIQSQSGAPNSSNRRVLHRQEVALMLRHPSLINCVNRTAFARSHRSCIAIF